MRKQTWILIAILLLGVVPGHAAEGRREIFRQVDLDAGAGDVVDGKFFVSRNIAATIMPGAPVIRIVGTGIENVEVNLNGFTLVGGTGEVVSVSNVRSFTLRNGSLVAGTGTQHVISVIGGSGADDRVTIEDVKTTGGNDGIFLDNVTNFVIRRNLVIAPTASGIEIDDTHPSTAPLTGLIANNVVREILDGSGIRIKKTNRSVTIRDNHIVVISLIDLIGIFVEGFQSLIIAGNNVTGGGTGIKVLNGNECTIERNAVSPGNFSGLELEEANQCLIQENVLGSATLHGIILKGATNGSDNNHIERNNISNNVRNGIFISIGCDGNTYGRNSLRQNTDAPACGANASPCAAAAVCDKGGQTSANLSFGDNLDDGGGC